MRSRLGIAIVLAVICAAGARGAPAPAAKGDEVLQYLNRTIDWYRRAAAVAQEAVTSEEVVYRETVRETSEQVLKLAFEFGKGAAALLGMNGGTAGATAGTQPTNRLSAAAATAERRVSDLQTELDRLERDVRAATQPAALPVMRAQRDKVVAQLRLAEARRDVLRNLTAFVAEPQGGSAEDLLDKIADLQRSVPEAQVEEQVSAAATRPAAGLAAAAAAAPAYRPEATGIFSLISEMMTLSRKMRDLKDVADQAEALGKEDERLRGPIRTALRDAIQRSEALSATQPAAAATSQAGGEDVIAKLNADRRELEALTARFRALSDASVPLGEQRIALEAARTNLVQWRAVIGRQYARALRSLVLRLGGLVAALVVVFAVSSLWRRATYQYVQEARRRRQIMLVRRVVVTFIVVLVLVMTFVSEFGSLATFAGLITAGIAVSLQTVILSGVAYFFYIGRYGVRVGDRVTVAGITGEVVETGLFRLYLMEMGGSERLHPTGRIVVFSNSVLFQPQAFFKQMPGADYTWHEIALTLAPETDVTLAQDRVMGAVESVYGEYRERVERQHEEVTRTAHVRMPEPKPEARLKLVDTGLEIVVRYPVEIRRASEVDDRITRALVETIAREPKLKLVGAGTPRIQPSG